VGWEKVGKRWVGARKGGWERGGEEVGKRSEWRASESRNGAIETQRNERVPMENEAKTHLYMGMGKKSDSHYMLICGYTYVFREEAVAEMGLGKSQKLRDLKPEIALTKLTMR